MASKYVAFVGSWIGNVACECGNLMERLEDGSYRCTYKMCQRYQKEYTAIVTAPVLFYEKEKS